MHDVADQTVRVEPNHLDAALLFEDFDFTGFADAPRVAIAAFMSEIDTTVRSSPNMPFKAPTDRVAAMNSNGPGVNFNELNPVAGAQANRLAKACWNRDFALAGEGG